MALKFKSIKRIESLQTEHEGCVIRVLAGIEIYPL